MIDFIIAETLQTAKNIFEDLTKKVIKFYAVREGSDSLRQSAELSSPKNRLNINRAQ